MFPRRWLRMGSGLLTLFGLAAGISLWVSRLVPRVTAGTFHRLRLGMTSAQVEHRLGPPSPLRTWRAARASA